MAEFHTLLTFDAPAPAGGDPEKETQLDAAKAAVAANANLFMGMNEEEFAKYLQAFVQDVWVLLTKVTLEPRQVSSQVLKGACAPPRAAARRRQRGCLSMHAVVCSIDTWRLQ